MTLALYRCLVLRGWLRPRFAEVDIISIVLGAKNSAVVLGSHEPMHLEIKSMSLYARSRLLWYMLPTAYTKCGQSVATRAKPTSNLTAQVVAKLIHVAF